MTERPCKHVPGAPPWLWLWLLLYILQLPEMASWPFRMDVPPVSAVEPDDVGRPAANDGALKRLNQVANAFRVFLAKSRAIVIPMVLLILLVPLFVPAISMLGYANPRWRMCRVEKKFGLVPASNFAAVEGVDEIVQFVATHAPSIEVRMNLARTGIPPFCYVSGYTSSRVAIFGDLVMQWQKDRELAESVLFHELCHVRRGDAMFVGPAGLLQDSFRSLAGFAGIILMIPNVVMIVAMLSVMGLCIHDGDVIALLFAVVTFLIMLVLGLLIAALIWLLLMGVISAFWISLVIAVWSAELNADYVANAQMPTDSGILKALSVRSRYASLWQQYLSAFIHPPTMLRHWLASRPRLALAVLLVAFPLSLFSIGVILITVSALGDVAYGNPAALDTWIESVSRLLLNRSGRLLVLGLVCIAWPLLWKKWVQIWSKDVTANGSAPPRKVYWLIGTVWCLVALIGLALDLPAGLRGFVMFGM